MYWYFIYYGLFQVKNVFHSKINFLMIFLNVFGTFIFLYLIDLFFRNTTKNKNSPIRITNYLKKRCSITCRSIYGWLENNTSFECATHVNCINSTMGLFFFFFAYFCRKTISDHFLRHFIFKFLEVSGHK